MNGSTNGWNALLHFWSKICWHTVLKHAFSTGSITQSYSLHNYTITLIISIVLNSTMSPTSKNCHSNLTASFARHLVSNGSVVESRFAIPWLPVSIPLSVTGWLFDLNWPLNPPFLLSTFMIKHINLSMHAYCCPFWTFYKILTYCWQFACENPSNKWRRLRRFCKMFSIMHTMIPNWPQSCFAKNNKPQSNSDGRNVKVTDKTLV